MAPRTNIPLPKGKLKSQEIIKCGSDPIYFMKKYVYISHPKKGLIKFDTYPFQDECVRDFQQNRFNIVLKSRQLGLSTVCAAYCLWLAIFQKERNILVIATKLEVAKNFLRKILTMWDSLPDWLVITKEKGRSVKYIDFTNGSRITAIPTGDDAGRGEGVSLLVCDEAAHIENFDNLWMGLYSTVSTGGNIILLSTPKGAGNTFHKLWTGCDLEKKENDFHGIKLPWTVHPEHDEEWFEKECRNLDPRGIQQELLCSFLGSGHTYFNEEALSYLNQLITTPIAKIGEGGNTWIWKMPITGHKYLVSADVARGDAEDYSTSHVFDLDMDEVVAEFQGKIPPDRFAELLADLGYKYNTAIICSENNSFGMVTALKLRDLKYPNLYYEKFAKAGVYQKPTPEEVADLTPGLSTTVKNKQQLLAKLEEVLRNRKLRIYSSRFLEETKTFVWKESATGGKAHTMKGYHDDLIMSLAIGNFIFEANNSSTDQDAMTRAMLAAWKRSSTYLSQGVGLGSPMFVQKQVVGENVKEQNNRYYKEDATDSNTPVGVKKENLQNVINVYNDYSWLFDK